MNKDTRRAFKLIVVITAFLLGVSVVLNFWISFEYLRLSKEYRALKASIEQSEKKQD